MNTREANPRVGTGYIAYTDYRNEKRFKKGYYVTRRNITTQQPVVFYIDTLIQDSWVKAIQKSADEWNIIFEAYFLLGDFGSVGGRQSRACFLSAV